MTDIRGRADPRKAWMSWSSGKDSTLALQTVRASGDVNVVGLVTTVNVTAERVAMHAVRRSLLEAQADVLGLPLHVVDLPWPCPNEVYEERMSVAIAVAWTSGINTMVYGDLFLEDVRRYREESLRGSGSRRCFRCGSCQPRPSRVNLLPTASEPSSRALIPIRHRGSWPGAGTTRHCWPTCRHPSIPAVRMASSTPSL